MILSLVISGDRPLDVYSFFFVPGSISCPYVEWYPCISASLRLKREVLVLEAPIDFPYWSSHKRWDVGDNWCWLSLRSRKAIEDFHRQSKDYGVFKSLLSQAK